MNRTRAAIPALTRFDWAALSEPAGIERLRGLVFSALVQKQMTTATAKFILAEAVAIARASRVDEPHLAAILRELIEKEPPLDECG